MIVKRMMIAGTAVLMGVWLLIGMVAGRRQRNAARHSIARA